MRITELDNERMMRAVRAVALGCDGLSGPEELSILMGRILRMATVCTELDGAERPTGDDPVNRYEHERAADLMRTLHRDGAPASSYLYVACAFLAEIRALMMRGAD